MSYHADPSAEQLVARPTNATDGFTMIELLVVMVLISLVATFTIPTIRTSLYSDQLKATARHLIGLVTEVSQDAVSNQSEYRLNFDLENDQVSVAQGASKNIQADGPTGGKRLNIPESVRVVDIESVHGGKSAQGTATLTFSKKGYVDKTAIHLRSDDGRDMTIVLSPFMGAVRIFDSYMDLDDDRVHF